MNDYQILIVSILLMVVAFFPIIVNVILEIKEIRRKKHEQNK